MELWECQLPSSTSTTQSNSSLLEQQKAKEKDSQTDSGLKRAELLSLLLRAQESTRDYSSSKELRWVPVNKDNCQFLFSLRDEFGFQYRNGVIGVPITFMDSYNPTQYEIVGITLGNTVDYPMTRLYENAIQHNKDGSIQGGRKVNTRAAVFTSEEPLDTVFYTADGIDGYLLSIYPRILIRPKKGS